MPRTIAELFYEGLEHGIQDAMAYKRNGSFVAISHGDVQRIVEWLALALDARGLVRGDRVAILSENRPEWAQMDYACAILGLVVVPVYPTLTAPQVAIPLEHSGVTWVLCSGPDYLKKVLEQWPNLPDLTTAVLMDGEPPKDCPRTILTWAQLLKEGRALEARRPEVRRWAEARQPEDLLTIIYTSGTTGEPKGTMLTHGNMASDAVMTMQVISPRPGERYLSHLPLCHVYERCAGHYVMFLGGACIYYVDTLGALPSTMLELKPEIICSVPRLYERIYDKVRDAVAAKSLLGRVLFWWCVGLARKAVPYAWRGERPGLWIRACKWVADRLVFNRIRARTGGRLRVAISGGAALSPKLLEFFWMAGVPLYEGYGLTETSPIITLSRPGSIRSGYVGEPLVPEWEGRPFLKLAGDGEILVRGPNVMKGYWNNPEETARCMDAEGYFHTGDVGEMDALTRVKITDRKKEILVTSGGKNVYPAPIENLLRSDRYISHAFVVGDHRNYLAALLVPNFAALRQWLEHQHRSPGTDAELVRDAAVFSLLQRRVDRINSQLSAFEKIRRIALLDHDFTVEGGQLSASLKLRRRFAYELYAEQIEALYEEGRT